MKQVPVISVLKFQTSFLAKHKISIHSAIQISYHFMEYLPVTLQEDGYLVPCTNIHLFLMFVNTVGDVGGLLFHGQQHIASVVIKAYRWQHKASLNRSRYQTHNPTNLFLLTKHSIQLFDTTLFTQAAVMSIKFSSI